MLSAAGTPAHQHHLLRGLICLSVMVFGGLAILWGYATFGVQAKGHFQRMPREVAEHLLQRSLGHNLLILEAGRLIHGGLLTLDRGWSRLEPLDIEPPSLPMASPSAELRASGTSVVELVTSVDGLALAMAKAGPGTSIVLAPGQYKVTKQLATYTAGRADAPIMVRGAVPGSAKLLVQGGGFLIGHPHWILQDLSIEGICGHDDYCEHAIQVSGAAHHTIIRRNRIVNFSSHIKINAHNGQNPDDGELSWNQLYNTRARDTTKPTNVVDIVAASRWHIHHNFVSDFSNTDPKRTSFGIYAKGGGSDNVLEHNVVICENQLRGQRGARSGISFGGGGTGETFCRDGKRCASGEHLRGAIRHNLVAACSSAGIYLNRARDAMVHHNTLLDTTGLEARFPETRARLVGNLIDGPVLERDDAWLLIDTDNRYNPWWMPYAGLHPHRSPAANHLPAFAQP